MRRSPQLTVELYDRHAEHVDPKMPLCVHERVRIRPGDQLVITDLNGEVGTLTYHRGGRLVLVLNTDEYRQELSRRHA